MKKQKISLALLLLLMGGSLFAKEASKLGEITVTSATMTEQLLKDVPSTMEVITAEDIQKSGVKTAKDALEDANNIQVRGNIVTIRGFDSSQLIVLVNGRKQVGYGIPWENNAEIVNQMDAANIERIEIIRGTAGAIYGSSATAGIINIITKRSSEESYTTGFSVENNSYSTSLRADLGAFGEENKWDAVLYGSYTEYHGENDSYGKRSEPSHVTNLSQPRGNRTYLSGDVGYQIDEDQQLGMFAEFSDIDEFTTTYYPDTGQKRDSNFAGSIMKTGSLALDYTGHFDDHTITSYVSGNKQFDKSSDRNNAYAYYKAKAMDSWMLNNNHLLTFGIEATLYTASNPDYIKDTEEIYAAFVQDEITLFDESLFIVPAIRVENYSSFGTNTTPSIGTTWEFIENNRLKLTYGLGFRAPEPIELYGYGYNRNGTTAPNPDLEPEESKNFEVTYEFDIDNFGASIGYYHSKIDNFVQGILDVGDSVCAPGTADPGECNSRINLPGESTFSGIEVETNYDIDALSLSLNHYYMDNEDEDGKRITRTAEHTTTAKISYDFPDNFYTGFKATRYGNFLESVNNEHSFYATSIDISKSWKDKYTLTLAIDNLLSTENDYFNNSYTALDWSINFTMKF